MATPLRDVGSDGVWSFPGRRFGRIVRFVGIWGWFSVGVGVTSAWSQGIETSLQPGYAVQQRANQINNSRPYSVTPAPGPGAGTGTGTNAAGLSAPGYFPLGAGATGNTYAGSNTGATGNSGATYAQSRVGGGLTSSAAANASRIDPYWNPYFNSGSPSQSTMTWMWLKSQNGSATPRNGDWGPVGRIPGSTGSIGAIGSTGATGATGRLSGVDPYAATGIRRGESVNFSSLSPTRETGGRSPSRDPLQDRVGQLSAERGVNGAVRDVDNANGSGRRAAVIPYGGSRPGGEAARYFQRGTVASGAASSSAKARGNGAVSDRTSVFGRHAQYFNTNGYPRPPR